MSKRDYYEVLGIARTASPDEIKKAYRQTALKFHPDRNPGDAEAEAKFKEATEAFSALSDDQKRARYDQFGFEGLEGGFDNANSTDIFSHFQDLFSEFFGGSSGGRGQRGQQQQRRGSDVRVQERLTLKDAVLGCKRELSFRAAAPCDDCRGSGAAAGSSRKPCIACAGMGQVSTARGFVMFTQTCPRCQGQGSIVETPCPKCKGHGQVEKNRKVSVSFPAGIDAGQRLRVPGQGMPGPDGTPAGDLYVDVELERDANYERDDLDLVTRLKISFAQAALGATVPLMQLNGSQLDVDVPAGAQPGDVISLKSHGVPRVDGRGKGSLHIVVQVDVPKKLSPQARELLNALDAELKQSSPSPTGPAGKRASAE